MRRAAPSRLIMTKFGEFVHLLYAVAQLGTQGAPTQNIKEGPGPLSLPQDYFQLAGSSLEANTIYTISKTYSILPASRKQS